MTGLSCVLEPQDQYGTLFTKATWTRTHRDMQAVLNHSGDGIISTHSSGTLDTDTLAHPGTQEAI